MDKGLLPNSKPKKKLHVPIYEYFYLTKEEYESDLRFLDKIYEEKEPSDLKIENSWIWGRHLWIEEYRKFGSNLSYKTLCLYSRKTEANTTRQEEENLRFRRLECARTQSLLIDRKSVV